MSSISSVSYNNALDLQRPDSAAMRKKMFQDADTDGSGSISQDELTAILDKAPKGPEGAEETDSTALFAEIDTDGNGEISETENDTYLEAKDAERAQNGQGGPGGPGGPGGSDLVSSLVDLLKQLQEEDSTTTSTDSTSSTDATSTASTSSTSSSTSTDETDETDTKKALEAAITNLLAELKSRNPVYGSTGENTSSASFNLFTGEA